MHSRLVGGVWDSFGIMGVLVPYEMRRRSRHPLLARAFLNQGLVRSGGNADWLVVCGLALGVWGALVLCEDV